MKKFFIGRSPLTTIAGYILAMLTGIHEMGTPGSHSWQDYLLPAALALFGRLAGDDRGNDTPSAPLPSPVPDHPEPAAEIESTSFLRRGKRHRQKRNSDGRFALSIA